MRRTILRILAAGTLLIAAAPFRLAPADDKVVPIGAAARAKNGPEPLTRPPEDVGMAEDPPAGAVPLPPMAKDKQAPQQPRHP